MYFKRLIKLLFNIIIKENFIKKVIELFYYIIN